MKRDRFLLGRSRQLRQDQTWAEARLWRELRNRRFVGYKFRRQHAIGPYIADFYCAEAGLIIELDGESHLGRAEHDRRRQDWLESRGLKVLRFFNNDIPANLDDLMECVFRECRSRAPMVEVKSPRPGPPTPGGKDGHSSDAGAPDATTPHPRPLSPPGRGETEGRSTPDHDEPRSTLDHDEADGRLADQSPSPRARP